MSGDEEAIESLQQKHEEIVERGRELHTQRAKYVQDETRRRTEDRNDFSGSFSTTSIRKLDPNHPGNRHLKPHRIETINEVLEVVLKTDRYRTISGEIYLNSRELDEVWDEIAELVVDEDETKKSNIGAIWSVLGTDVSKRRLVDAVDCHRQYPTRLKLNEESGEVEYKDRVKRRKQNQVRPDHRKEIIARDDSQCVRCGNPNQDELLVHHIIPVSQDGTAQDNNLATLCKDCHNESHDYSNSGDVVYGDRSGFEVWIQGATRGLESQQRRLSDF